MSKVLSREEFDSRPDHWKLLAEGGLRLEVRTLHATIEALAEALKWEVSEPRGLMSDQAMRLHALKEKGWIS